MSSSRRTPLRDGVSEAKDLLLWKYETLQSQQTPLQNDIAFETGSNKTLPA